MPRSAEQNAEIRNERRQLLVTAATKVFTRMGFAAARMSDIAREAGLSHGLAYHYFPGKDAVFVAVIEATMGTGNELAHEALKGKGRAIERLRKLCALMLEGAKRNPGNSAVLLQVAGSEAAPEEARAYLERSSRQVIATFTKLIIEAQAEGDASPDDAKMLARTLVSTLSGLAMSMTGGAASGGTLPTADIVLRLVKRHGSARK